MTPQPNLRTRRDPHWRSILLLLPSFGSMFVWLGPGDQPHLQPCTKYPDKSFARLLTIKSYKHTLYPSCIYSIFPLRLCEGKQTSVWLKLHDLPTLVRRRGLFSPIQHIFIFRFVFIPSDVRETRTSVHKM